MFEGVQDHFHQFLASTAQPPPPPPQPPQQQQPVRAYPLSFSLLQASNPNSSSPSTNPNSFPIFDAYAPHPHLPPPNHHHHHILPPPPHHQFSPPPPHVRPGIKQEGEATSGFLSTSLNQERERSMAPPPDSAEPWSHDEVLALFRIRSAMENWFPEFTWEHISRKMAEMGFKRSPQKCKERFEEESRYFNDNGASRSYRIFSELEELYHPNNNQLAFAPREGCKTQNDVVLEKENLQEEQEQVQEKGKEQEEGRDNMGQDQRLLEENDGSEPSEHDDAIDEMEKKKKKRDQHQLRSKKKFEIFKSFCEEIVNKMMIQQEELHKKILEDINKKDEEKIAREESWRKQEIERINSEMAARVRDQAIASDRQAKIIEFLHKFTSNDVVLKPSFDHPSLSNIPTLSQNPSSSATHSSQNHIPASSNDESLSQTSNSLTTHIDPNPNTVKLSHPSPKKPRSSKKAYNSESNDTGKRWPRDEVLALINIRCNIDLNSRPISEDPGQNNSNSNSNYNSVAKNTPLWERISQKMLELGHKRSAKRCKEKWENINKYFRKTKDMNKKRSVDSRTCPYFHQLSHLYTQGRIMGGGPGGAASSEAVAGGSVGGDQGEGNVVQVEASACDFEF